MKNYIISVGFLCLGMAAKAQLGSKPKQNPLSTITEIKPGSVLNKKLKFNSLQGSPKVSNLRPASSSQLESTIRILNSKLDGMPVILPSLQGLAPMPIAKPSEDFSSGMPIKDLPSQYR